MIMRRSLFGQYPVYTYPMYSPTVVYPGMYPSYSPVTFRKSEGMPMQQPYQMDISQEQLEQAIYKDLPTKVTGETSAAGTTPQKVIKLKSGLEVPSYIVQRDIERKKMGVKSEPLPEPPKPTTILEKLSVFIAKKPLIAAIAAIAAGIATGNWYYDFKH